MENIPTAIEFFNKKTVKYNGNVATIMKEFAKLHVQATLKAAANVANEWENSDELSPEILNSYPLTNIK